MAIYMLDTDICSYIIRENPKSVKKQFWEHKNDNLCISFITYAELTYGAIRKGSTIMLEKIKVFVSHINKIDFNAAAAEEYACIRMFLETQGTPIGGLDMLIAASAKSSNAVLVTNNERHFSRIPDLAIENWSSS